MPCVPYVPCVPGVPCVPCRCPQLISAGADVTVLDLSMQPVTERVRDPVLKVHPIDPAWKRVYPLTSRHTDPLVLRPQGVPD